MSPANFTEDRVLYIPRLRRLKYVIIRIIVDPIGVVDETVVHHDVVDRQMTLVKVVEQCA